MKGVLRNFAKIRRETTVAESPFDKVASVWPATLIKRVFGKKVTLAQVFSCEFREISKTAFFTEHHWTAASATFG